MGWTTPSAPREHEGVTAGDVEHDTVVDPTIVVPSLPRRLLAIAVDGAIAASAGLALDAAIGRPLPLSQPFEPDAWARWVEAGGVAPFVVLAAAVGGALQVALHRSPGKLLFGLEVVRTDGALARRPRLAVRAGLALIGTLLAGLGPAWVLLSPRQRALHDLATRTAVARRARRSSGRPRR